MSNVLSDEKRQQILALGRLGWTLRQIEQAIGVRRETASNYLKAAGIEVYPPGRRGEMHGSALLTSEGSRVWVDSVTEKNGLFTVYNIEVGVAHVYHVSHLGVLVHNQCQAGGTGTGEGSEGNGYDYRRGGSPA